MLIEAIRAHARAKLNAGHTQRSIARAADIKPSQLSRFLNGHEGMSIEKLDCLAGVLNVKVSPVARA